MKKITKATLKSFIKNNANNLYIFKKSSFDGMVDGVVSCGERGFSKVQTDDRFPEHTLGIKGAWLVNGSRDYFRAHNDEEFQGIEISNCCGHFILAIKK